MLRRRTSVTRSSPSCTFRSKSAKAFSQCSANDAGPRPGRPSTWRPISELDRILPNLRQGDLEPAFGLSGADRVSAQFVPQNCTPTRGTLGSGGATPIYSDVPGLPPSIWYSSAHADAMTGRDLEFEFRDDDERDEPPRPDIRTRLNSEGEIIDFSVRYRYTQRLIAE